jgi:hypothetical protein
MVLVNSPPILAASGTELLREVWELRPFLLAAGIALQWFVMVAAWVALGGRRRLRPLVSIIVAGWSGLFVLHAVLNQINHDYQTETRLAGCVFAIFLLLGLWAARGSNVGTLLLATALLAAAMAILVASRNDSVPPELVRDYSVSLWRFPAFLTLLAGALLYDRWHARRQTT